MRFWQLAGLFMGACATAFIGHSAKAYDYDAQAAFRIFTASCVRGLAQPDNVRNWAESTRLKLITDPADLNTFVGPGQGGTAWTLPSTNDRRITLSLRGGTQACVVWAERADPKSAEELFREMVQGAAKADVAVKIETEQVFSTATGKARLLIMSVADKNGEGYQFTFMAGDRPGTFFSGAPVQVSMQMARLEGKKPAKKK
jgi:hypothetical protein